jgi:hypothetical protein
MTHRQEQDFTTERRKFLKYLGVGGLASLFAALTKVSAKASTDGPIAVTRLAAYFNATSDWMAWAQVMNENPDPHQVHVSVYNLAGDLLVNTIVSLNPYQTQTIPLETLTEVKGKQGMVILASEENKRLAACLVFRKASQPDYTSVTVPFSATALSS